jgi:integrase
MTIYDCAVMLAETRTGRQVAEICSRRLRVHQGLREVQQPGLWIWITRRFQGVVGEVDVAQLTVGHLVRFIAEEKRQGKKAKTIRNHVAILRRVWRFAYTLQLTEKPPPPLDLDALVPLEKPRNGAWSVEQLRAVIGVIEAQDAYPLRGRFSRVCGLSAVDWWRALVLFLYHTAMRIGSALLLTPADYVWNGNGSALVCVRERKNQKQEWREYAVPEMIAAVSRIYHPSRERLFPWPYSRTALNNQARAIFERALGPLPRGPGSLFHAIRRTAATAAAQRYGDGAAQLLLMHTTSKTTREHYIDASKIIRQPPVLPQLTEEKGRQLELFTS